jgi:hypothetical protein
LHALTAAPIDGAASVLIVNGHALAPQVVAVVQLQVAFGSVAVRLAQCAYRIELVDERKHLIYIHFTIKSSLADADQARFVLGVEFLALDIIFAVVLAPRHIRHRVQ